MKREFKCPYCERLRKLTDDEVDALIYVGKVVITDCPCNKLWTVMDDGDAIFTCIRKERNNE